METVGFQGRIETMRRAGSFRLTVTSYRPDGRIAPHFHPNAYACLVLDGSYRETAGGVDRDCETATLLLRPRGQVHATRFSPSGARCFMIEFEDPLRERLPREPRALDRPSEHRGGGPLRLAQRMFREFRTTDAAGDLAVEGLGYELLACLLRQRAPRPSLRPPAWLRAVRDLLEARFAEPVSLEALAAEVGVHPVHLARAFRNAHGCTVGEYVRRLRLAEARWRMVESGDSLAAIAAAAGFCDQSHLCRLFRREMGLAPSAYRRMRRRR